MNSPFASSPFAPQQQLAQPPPVGGQSTQHMTQGKDLLGKPFSVPGIQRTGAGPLDYDMNALQQYMQAKGITGQPQDFLAMILKRRQQGMMKPQPQQQNASAPESSF